MTGFRKYRRGDVISVRAVVQHAVDDGDDYVHIKVGGSTRGAADFDQIIGFIQPAVEVDDIVRLTEDHVRSGITRAVVESGGSTFLMVEIAPGRMETWLASHVEVANPPPAFPGATAD